MADRMSHGEYGQTKGDGDPGKPNPQVGESRGQDRTAASSEHQPERSEKLRCRALSDSPSSASSS